MANSWIRTRQIGPINLNDKMGSRHVRYYLDAVRSDGTQLRAGVDVLNGTPEEKIDAALSASLDEFLDKPHLVLPVVDVTAHMGEEGWVERG
ncbi:MAG: hypothetical protein ACLPN2_03405 [Terriglobales bacterium]